MDANNINLMEQFLKLNDTLKKYNISLSTFLFVACVEHEELSLGDIGEKLGITSAGMTTIRDSASYKCFIKEITTEDRRKKVYTITDKGIELIASCRQ